MKSNWVSVKPNYLPPSNARELMDKINKQLDEQIECYELNLNGNEDVYIKSNLKLIKDLAQNVKNSDDIRSIEKIISTFCEIMDIQRETIYELSVVDTQVLGHSVPKNNYMPSLVTSNEKFSNDEQIKETFIAYMKEKGKSGFTTSDYILRVQNLWRDFEHDYLTGRLEENMLDLVPEEQIALGYPLLNAYRHLNALNRYVALNIEKNPQDRNWANTRSAINTFGKALYKTEYEKVKLPRESTSSRDFSKYNFNGKTYGKSRLVLAVVRQYVEDYQPSTLEELKVAFPDDLQGSLGVVRDINDVSDKYKGIGGVKRYFVNEDETIHLSSGEKVVVCTQFGAENAERFIEHVINTLGYIIQKV